MTDTVQPDVELGPWVYCKSHVGPHETGWCSVGVDNKIALDLPGTASRKEANDLVWSLGLHIFGYCDVCHKWICNEPWFRDYSRKTCPEHDA